MKILYKSLKYTVTGVLTLILTYLLAAVILSYISTGSAPRDCPRKHPVYVSTNGVHLFLILKKADLPKDFLNKLSAPASAEFVSLGWGDKHFYLNTPTWDDLTFHTAIKAMLWPSETAMHVSYYRNPQASWRKVDLCKNQLTEIVEFSVNSFENTEGDYQPIGAPGYGENNYFYEATGSYTCFRTSNVWVNQALKKAEVKTSVWSPFDFGVMHHLE